MHAELAADLSANRVDLLFGAGPLTRALYDAAPASMRAAWAERVQRADRRSRHVLRGGEHHLLKAPTGTRIGPLVAALRDRFAHGAGG